MDRSNRKEVTFSKALARKNQIELINLDSFQPVLYNNLYVPSYVHSYSLAIEYAKKWFLDKFDPNYFKYVHINGKHMFDDYKRFNKQNVKREKPLAIITPIMDFDYDRETLDLYNAGAEIFLKRSDFQRSFFKDYDNNLYLGFQMKELKMNFNYRVKVSTRAQQLDLLDKMALRFRIGGTNTEYKTIDFVIPKDILLNIAVDKGFEIENGEIKKPTLFVQYINSHSDIPIFYKLRAINNKLEYFMRLDNICCNLAMPSKLSPDDGEREGMLDNNFNIDMEITLRMAIPHFFVYFNEKPLKFAINTDTSTVGICSLSQFLIEPKNEYNWDTFMNTIYQLDIKETHINFKEVLDGTPLDKVIKSTISKGISPKTFVDIKVFKEEAGEYPMIYSKMDFDKYILEIQEQKYKRDIYIVIYMDKDYYNDELLTITKMDGIDRVQ